jgi:hypothetical protein
MAGVREAWMPEPISPARMVVMVILPAVALCAITHQLVQS